MCVCVSLYHLRTIKHMPNVYPYIRLKRQDNTLTNEAIFSHSGCCRVVIAMDIRLYDLCSGVSMVRVQIPCKENKNNVSSKI